MKSKPIGRTSIAAKLPKREEDTKRNQLRKITKWAATVGEHPHLYCPPTQATHYHYYQIEFYEISDIEVLLGKRKQYIQITCILFNKQAQSFVGSTYASQMFEVEANISEKPSCLCKKSVFFYTDQQEMCLKVDIWRLQSQKNGKGIQNMTKRMYLGHFEADLGESRESGIIQKQLKNNQLLRFVAVQESEPRTEMSEQQVKKKPSKIVYRVINTHSLSHLHHFIPANHVFDEHNCILGLKDMKIGSKGEIEMGDRSRLIFQLKSVTIPLTIIKYLTDISQLKISSTFVISGRPNINIKEMRFNMQFHNGWKSICFESIVLKEAGAQTQTVGIETNRSLMPSKMQSKVSKAKQPVMKNKVYTFDKPKELKAVFVGEGALIIWIEAKVQCKFDTLENGAKKSKGDVFFLPLAFALKTLPQFEEQTDFNIQLFEGNPYSFVCLIDYFSSLKNKGQQLDLSDKLVCNISMLLQKSGGTIDNIETVEKEINDIQNLKIEKERLARLKRKVREEKRKKLIELNQQIPFLDTTQLKEELYQEQLTKVKNEKLQQQQILFFLKAKINQLEREAFKNELNIEEIEDQDSFSPNKVKVKKLPNNFIDYRPEPQTTTATQSTVLSYFNNKYCKLALAHPRLASNKLLQECMQGQAFLQLKITSFECFQPQIKTYNLMVPNFEGRFECLAITPMQFANKSVQIKLSFSREKTMDILNSLLNGCFQLFLQCDGNQHLKGTSLITVSQLISKCNSGDLLQSINENVLFAQEGTPLAYASFIIAFTNASNTQAKAEVVKVQEKINASPSKQFSMLTRIQRFKEEKGLSDKKKELVNQILSTSKVNKISVTVQQSRPSKFKISIANTSNIKQEYLIYIFDEDEPYLNKEELLISTNPHLFISKNDKRVEVEPNVSEQLQFAYHSERININMSTIRRFDKRKLHNLYKDYNHQHKININFAKKKSNIVIERYEVTILPQSQYSNLVISKFIAKEEHFSFPIPTVNLEVSHNKNIAQSTTGINLHVPELRKQQLHLSHFQLMKRSKECNLIFQRIQFYGWKCQAMQVSARLWETKDVLLKLPFQAILNEQLSLPYLIQDLIIASHHINLKIRQAGTFAYTSELKVNRKMNEIFIRAQATFNQIGKFTYGVEIADKNQHVFHRIGVTSHIEFPNLASHHIIPIKVPKDNIQAIEPFAFKNRQQVGMDYELKCNQPHLLTFKESKTFLKEGQEWTIQLQFNWNRIMDEMIDQSKEEVSILVGIISKLAIQYFLFKCRTS